MLAEEMTPSVSYLGLALGCHAPGCAPERGDHLGTREASSTPLLLLGGECDVFTYRDCTSLPLVISSQSPSNTVQAPTVRVNTTYLSCRVWVHSTSLQYVGTFS